MAKKYDFSGWATKNDLLCADGRIIRRDAFKDNDGQTVPLVYQHQHNDPLGILGHALLENRADGVYAYCSFNDTPTAQHVKSAVEHGDVVSLSIYANRLVQNGKDVLHGLIREVSIVLAGANPGAYIDNPILVHGEGTADERYEDVLDEAVVYTGEPIELFHADQKDEEKKEEEKKEEAKPEEEEPENKESEAKLKPEAAPEADEKKSDEGNNKKEDAEMADNKEKTVQDVFDELTEEQKKVVYFMIGQALEDAKGGTDDDDEDEDEGDTDMKHNVFDNDQNYGPVLSHSDEMEILSAAKKYGSFREAFEAFADSNDLSHDALAAVSGFTSYPDGNTPAGVDALFPEWHDVRPGAPEIITDDQAWVKEVLNGVHRSPYSRIRTSQVDLRNIEGIRAKGYKKGNEKVLAANYNVARRTTSPTTVYVKSALNRDDIVDITDFDYVGYQYQIDRMQLEKELAVAILFGDGRDAAAADKIDPECIRPIWTDSDIFTMHKVIDISGTPNGTNTAANFGEGYLYAQAAEEAILEAKIDYRGSGALKMFCAQSFFNKMLLAKDLNGRRVYANKNELMAALDVSKLYNVPEMGNLTRTDATTGKTYKLLAILVNLGDYNLGATKGGEITHFTQFDIDFNQEKSLLETRVSGANTRIYSAIVLEEEVNPQGD